MVREVPGGTGRIVGAECGGGSSAWTASVGGRGVGVGALVLMGVLGRLDGAESLDDDDRVCLGGESWPSLLSSLSRRRRWEIERLAELVCCWDLPVDFICGAGLHPVG